MNIQKGIDKLKELLAAYEVEEDIHERDAKFLPVNFAQLTVILEAMKKD